jgi:DNA-binding NarL/FixJ family response regulator
MLGDGLDNRRISSMLAISQRTVKFHVTSILRKLKVESRLQAGLAAAEYSRLAAFEA